MLTIKAEEYRKGAYLSFVLSEASRSQLLRVIPPAYEIKICHHVTFCFRFDEEKYKEMIEYFSSGEPLTVEAVGYSDFDGIEVISVRVLGTEKRHFDDSFYHITLSLDKTHKPKDSKTKLDYIAGIPDMALEPPIMLAGELQLVDM